MTFDNDYGTATTQLAIAIDRLFGTGRIPPLDVRQQTVDSLIEAFIDATGKRPDGVLVRRLSDYLLLDIIADRRKHQRGYEYPFLTTQQIHRRKQREKTLVDV